VSTDRKVGEKNRVEKWCEKEGKGKEIKDSHFEKHTADKMGGLKKKGEWKFYGKTKNIPGTRPK